MTVTMGVTAMPRPTTIRRATVTSALAVLLAACGSSGGSPTESGSPGAGSGAASPAATAATQDAEVYCTGHGGQLVNRVATWNTNQDPGARLQLAGRWTLCEFDTGGDSPTRISVDLTTLSSPQPTLASLAYLSKVPSTQPPQPSQNPAGWYCANDLDATSAFGNTVAGGGWVDQSQPIFDVMAMCVFADGSAIDEFGLWYHANGIIRGADLTPLFAYQPGDQLPGVFQRGAAGS